MLSGALSRYSTYSTENDETHGTIQSVEVNRLIKLLTRHLLHHDFERSGEIMEVLMSECFEIGEICMKVSREIMLHDENYDESVFENLLKFERQQFVISTKFRIENLLERVFLLVLHNRFSEAHQVLQKNVNSDPFRSSPLIQGYAGIVAYILWKAQEGTMEQEQAGKEPCAANDMYSETFLKQFKEMMKCIPPHQGVYSSFLSAYVEGLIQLKKEDVAIETVQEYIVKHPHDLIAHRLLIKLLLMFPDQQTKVMEVRQKLVQLDPSCPEVVPLAQWMLNNDEYDPCFILLVKFLDYPVNKDSVEAWTLLKELKEKWPELVTKPEWIRRQRRWKKIHKAMFSDNATKLEETSSKD